MSFGDDELNTLIRNAQNGPPNVQVRSQAILDEQPRLKSISRFYWNAFIELGTDRPIGMDGQGMIPLTAIRGYADDYALDALERDTFKRVIMAVDNRRQILINEKRRKRNARDKPPA